MPSDNFHDTARARLNQLRADIEALILKTGDLHHEVKEVEDEEEDYEWHLEGALSYLHDAHHRIESANHAYQTPTERLFDQIKDA